MLVRGIEPGPDGEASARNRNSVFNDRGRLTNWRQPNVWAPDALIGAIHWKLTNSAFDLELSCEGDCKQCRRVMIRMASLPRRRVELGDLGTPANRAFNAACTSCK